MAETHKKLRHRIAYFLASDWVNDLEQRLSTFLYKQTGGRMSGSYHPIEVMVSEAYDYQKRECKLCEYYRKETSGEFVDRNELRRIADLLELRHGNISCLTVGDLRCIAERARAAADVAPVVHGRWEEVSYYKNNILYLARRCSVCHADSGRKGVGNYCPHCGAKMDGE